MKSGWDLRKGCKKKEGKGCAFSPFSSSVYEVQLHMD